MQQKDITDGMDPFGTTRHTHSGQDAVLLPKKFIDRGDVDSYDFRVADFTVDSSWYELDLSAIVGMKAKAVVIGGFYRGFANNFIKFRKKGNSNDINVPAFRTQVDAIGIQGTLIVPIENGVIEYSANSLTVIDFIVVGWFE